MLVGAGHAHVEVLRSFAVEPAPGVSIVLVTRTRFTPYSGMLPGFVAGLYGFEEAHVDAQRLAAAAGAQFIEGTVVGLDLAARQVHCADGRTIGYDILSLDIGITPATGEVAGAAEHAIPVKPIDGFLARFEALLERVRAGSVRRVALVGGGAGGVELTLAVAHRLRRGASDAGHDPAIVNLQLVTRGARILPALPIDAARRLERQLSFRRVELLCDARVTAVAADHLRIEGRPPLPVEAVLWVTEAAARVGCTVRACRSTRQGLSLSGPDSASWGIPASSQLGMLCTSGRVTCPRQVSTRSAKGRCWPATSAAR